MQRLSLGAVGRLDRVGVAIGGQAKGPVLCSKRTPRPAASGRPMCHSSGMTKPAISDLLDRPHTLSGLAAKRAELEKYREQLQADLNVVICDMDHLDAAIRIFDPEDTPGARRRYLAIHKAVKGQATGFVLSQLRTAGRSLTSRELAENWCGERGLVAKHSTVCVITKRICATLTVLCTKGLVVRCGYVGARVGWQLASPTALLTVRAP